MKSAVHVLVLLCAIWTRSFATLFETKFTVCSNQAIPIPPGRPRYIVNVKMSDKKRPDWMSSISGIVNTDDYLLGRKIDKTYELAQQEKADKARELRTNLIASDKIKLVGDPILDLERRREELKLEIINNPIRLRRLRDRLLEEDRIRNSGKSNPRSNNAPESLKQVDVTRDPRRRSPNKIKDSSPPSSSDSSSSTSSSRDSSSHRHSRHSRSRRHKHKKRNSSRDRHTKRNKHLHQDDDSKKKNETRSHHSEFSERRKKSHHKRKHDRHSSRSPNHARRERERR